MQAYTLRVKSILAAVAIGLVLTGCGVNNENVGKGMEAVKLLDYNSALEHFQNGLAQGENKRLISRGMGIAYMGLTDYGQAAACFEEALSYSLGLVEPVDYDLNYYLAASYTKSGRLEDAEAVYGAILGMRPQEKDAYFLRGNTRLGLNKFEDAKADFDQVISMDPKDYGRIIQIYEVCTNYGYQDAGILYLQTALTQNESQMSAYDKGRIYYYLGDYQKAYLALEEAKDKGGADAYLYLGKAYEATGDYNYASTVYNAFLSKDTTNPQMYNQLGLCEMARGDYTKALAAFQSGKAIENNEIMQSLSFNEIVAYEYLGEFQQAAALMQIYIQTYPDDEKAQREYTFLSTR